MSWYAEDFTLIGSLCEIEKNILTCSNLDLVSFFIVRVGYQNRILHRIEY